MRRWLALLVLTVLAASATGCASESEPAPIAAPGLAGTDFDGVTRSLEDLRGQVVVVSVWASWCGPCRDEFPVLNEAVADFGEEGFAVFGVNFRDLPETAEAFIEEQRPDFPSLVDSDGSLSVSWGVSALPQSFLIDREGYIVARLPGAVNREWITGVVAEEVRR